MIILGLFILLLVAAFIGAIVVYYIGLWKVFQKAGKNGWEAIIPFYNNWVLVEISGLAWWYALIIILSSLGIFAYATGVGTLLSLASLVANYFVCYNLSKKFNQDIGFSVLMFFFSFVIFPLMGISDKYQYDANVIVNENGPINLNNNNNNNNNNNYSENVNNNRRFCTNCGKPIESNSNFCGECGKKVQ